MSRVIFSPQAEQDLLEIAIHIAQDNPEAADRFLERIDQICALIATSPKIGRLREEFAPTLRSFPVDHYVVFYVPTKRGIGVARILHGARDLPSLF